MRENLTVFKVFTDSISEVKVAQSCPTLCGPMEYTVCGILQARILEWVAFPFSRGSSQPSILKNARQIPILANLLNKASETSCKTIQEKYGIITLYLLPMPQYLLILVLRKYLNYSNFSISKCSK